LINVSRGHNVADVEDSYVASYLRSHSEPTVRYKTDYREYFMIDALFTPPYTALIAGCGTLGAPVKLLRGAKRIVGIDRSAKMLAAARQLTQDVRGKKIDLVQSDVAAFPPICREKFDFIELGLMGTYLPFDVDLIEAYASLLKPNGLLLVASVVIPLAGWRSEGLLTRVRHIASTALSTSLFCLSGKTTGRISVSLRVVVQAIERWLEKRANAGMRLIYHEVRKNAAEASVAYRALIQKQS
jgi:SAM-dependent methyltransferase